MFISKSPRRHVSQKVDDFGVPVIYKEQRTGRLYKLMLFKNEDLYKNPEDRHKNIGMVINHLSAKELKAQI